MGKLQSKHAGECFLVNAHLNKALEEQIWKKKSGLDLANYNMDESLSELSICLEDKCGSVPLRVELPPQMGETETSKVLKLDQDNGDDDDENKAEKANNLNIEEFECGVQFEGSEHSKQEWSFTLYDFDGHGRITKEDLASLLKALYDAVGSSIRLPPNGAKTLKLRLTVGQDRTQIHAISASKALTGGKRKENGGSGSKAKTSKESPKPPKQQFSKLNNLTRTTVKVNNQTQEAASQGQGQVQGQAPGGRKHLSAEDRQQLVELVQENMERNHVKQLRRHHSDCHAPGEKPGHHHKRRHRGRSSKTTAAAAASGGGGMSTAAPTATAMALAEDRGGGGGGGGGCRESQDRRNYYLDLAGVDSSKLNNITAAAANSNPTKVCNNNQPSSSSLLHPLLLEGGCGGGGGHHRSRSHDVTAATMMTMTATTTTTTMTGGGGGKYDNVKRESDRLLDSSAGAGAGAGAPSGRGVVVGLVGFNPSSSSAVPPTTSSSASHHHNLHQHSHHLRSRSFDPQDSANPRTSKSGGAPPANNATATSTTPAQVLLDSTRGAGLGGSPSHKHSRFRPVSLPGGGGGGGHNPLTTSTTTTTAAAAAAAVSPGHYHRRHRHREKDHDLAMQQVAAWIERQHAWDFDGQRSSGGSAGGGGGGGGGSGGVIVQRHHHHHIHEHHHHHHYHHYYEA